jgi:hypothetical protein
MDGYFVIVSATKKDGEYDFTCHATQEEAEALPHLHIIERVATGKVWWVLVSYTAYESVEFSITDNYQDAIEHSTVVNEDAERRADVECGTYYTQFIASVFSIDDEGTLTEWNLFSDDGELIRYDDDSDDDDSDDDDSDDDDSEEEIEGEKILI